MQFRYIERLKWQHLTHWGFSYFGARGHLSTNASHASWEPVETFCSAVQCNVNTWRIRKDEHFRHSLASCRELPNLEICVTTYLPLVHVVNDDQQHEISHGQISWWNGCWHIDKGVWNRQKSLLRHIITHKICSRNSNKPRDNHD